MPNYPTITSKIIKYDSPSGEVSIGKYIPPFEEVKEGYGYLGVLLEDIGTGKLQCHICGNWYGVFNSHLITHNITSEDYKKRFGLSKSTALKSKKVRLRQSEVMTELRKKKKYQIALNKNNSWAGNRKYLKKSPETKNKYGVCELQIVNKILKLAEELGKTPTLIDLKERYGGAIMFHIHRRYNSYVKLCRDLNLEPNYSNHNPKYSKEYFIQKAISDEPSLRILTQSEARNIYSYFKGGVNEWKKAVEEYKKENGLIA